MRRAGLRLPARDRGCPVLRMSVLCYVCVAYSGSMPISDRSAVQRVQPPKAPYNVVNRVLGWLVEAARRDGLSLIYLNVGGTVR